MTVDDTRRLGRLIVALGCVAFVVGVSLVSYATVVTGFPPRELADPLARLMASPYAPIAVAAVAVTYLGYVRWRRAGRGRQTTGGDDLESDSNR